MNITAIFSLIGITIFIGFIGEIIFDKTNVPDVFWLMLLGVIIGLSTGAGQSGIIAAIGPAFTTFALIFILFEGVLNINIKELASGAVEGGSLSFFNFIISMSTTALFMLMFGWGFLEGLLLGAILGDSAQAVIVPLVKKMKAKAQIGLALTFESAISDVLTIVGSLTIINIIMLNSFSAAFVLQRVIYSIVLAIIAGIVIALAWLKILPLMDRISKSYITTIGVLLLLYGGVESLEANGALAALAFGITLGNSKKISSLLKKTSAYSMSHSARFFYSEISFFLKTFFFVYLGLVINLGEPKLIIIGAALALALFLIRPASVWLSHRKSKLGLKERVYLEILNPKGLAAAVLAQLPAQFGLPHGDEFSTIVMSTIITSILLSILALYLAEKGRFKGIWNLLALDRGAIFLKSKISRLCAKLIK